jgi:imidazolonepropionase-like amidohydrolase
MRRRVPGVGVAVCGLIIDAARAVVRAQRAGRRLRTSGGSTDVYGTTGIVRAGLGTIIATTLSAGLVSAQAPARPSTAFTHVTVVDGTGSAAQSDMTVVVTGNRIAAVGRFGSVPVPAGARVIEARNQIMIPGLWDMHTPPFMRKNKMLPLLDLQLFIANGVTGIRDMGDQGVPDDFGDLPYVQDIEWRQAVAAGAAIGPRMTVAGVIVDGPNSPRKGWASVATDADARALVTSLKKLGVDFIKVYDRLTRDAFLAIADESRKQGLTFAGHVPFAVSPGAASDAGQRSEAHMWGMLVALSSREAELASAVNVDNRVAGLTSNLKALIDTYSEQKSAALFGKLKANNTYVVPTLVTKVPSVVPLTDPRIAKYMSPALQADYAGRLKGASAAAADPVRRQLAEMDLRMVRDMNRAGVKLLAGTDTLSFGFDLHDELTLLVKAGLTPMQALQAATLNAAEFVGKSDWLGTVQAGKLADLVLLDGNPLESIDNTRKIRTVVTDGRVLDRAALDGMLAAIEAGAK